MKRQFIVLVLSFCILFNLVPSVASATEIEPNEIRASCRESLLGLSTCYSL